MTQILIDPIFYELKRRGQCNSQDAFSLNWLGREKSYYRSLKSKKRDPSIESQLILAERLRKLGTLLETSEHPIVATAGRRYRALAASLVEAVLRAADQKALNAAAELART